MAAGAQKIVVFSGSGLSASSGALSLPGGLLLTPVRRLLSLSMLLPGEPALCKLGS